MHEWSTRMLLKHYLDQGPDQDGAVETVEGEPEDDPLLDRVQTAGSRRGRWGQTCYSPRPAVASKLDPYKGIIKARLQEFPKLSAQRLFDEVRAAGYGGGYSRVRD